jgi:SAM-dependent methyltransferase
MRAPRAHPPPPRPAPRRRALSHGSRRVEVVLDAAGLGDRLAEALGVPLDDASVSPHVHGFHSYPARMHPATARALVLAVSRPGARLLDPFCGSGTVLVEARLAGRRARGVDANPLAVLLARVKTRGYTSGEREALLVAADRVAAHAEARRKARAGPTRKYPPADRELFEIHVLLELDGLCAGLAEERPGPLREALDLVLSAILVKVSRQPGDTAADRKPRRLAAGYTIRLFLRKTEELVTRLAAFEELLPARSSRPIVEGGDARRLASIESGRAATIVTSPPYPGVYDYVGHHAARLRWLGLGGRALERDEIGARRQAGEQGARAAVTSWERDFGKTLREMARVLAPGGLAALVIADSVVGNQAIFADDYVPRLARKAGLDAVAHVRQGRPHVHRDSREAFRDRPRYEHVLVLSVSSGSPPRLGAKHR